MFSIDDIEYEVSIVGQRSGEDDYLVHLGHIDEELLSMGSNEKLASSLFELLVVYECFVQVEHESVLVVELRPEKGRLVLE